MEIVRAYKAGRSIAFIIPAHIARELKIIPKTQLAVIVTSNGTLEIAHAQDAIDKIPFRRKEQ